MIEFASSPSMGRAYARALLARKPGLAPGKSLPSLRASLAPRPLDGQHLAAYRDVCGLSAEVPMSYPQLLVTPVHIALLTHATFPLRAMGLVHPRCEVVQHRALAVGESLALEAAIEGQREVRNGIEFDLMTTGRVGDEVVWESRAATFSRTRPSTGGSAPEPDETWESEQSFDPPADAGRRYARVSGDANPVHLHPLTARLFGYKRPIAHGWWLLARCLGALDLDGVPAGTLELELRRPVWLGGKYRLTRRGEGDSTVFAVLEASNKVRLRGRFTPS
jgi:hypothetical protein